MYVYIIYLVCNKFNEYRSKLELYIAVTQCVYVCMRDCPNSKFVLSVIKRTAIYYTNSCIPYYRYKRRSVSSNSQTGESLTDSSEYLTDTMRALFVESTESEPSTGPGVIPQCETPCADLYNEGAVFFADNLWVVPNQVSNKDYSNSPINLTDHSSSQAIPDDLLQSCVMSASQGINMYHTTERGYEASMEDINPYHITSDVHVDTSVNYPVELNVNYAFDDSIPNSTGRMSLYQRSINSSGYNTDNTAHVNNINNEIYKTGHDFSLTHPPLNYRSNTDTMVTGLPTHSRYTNNDFRSGRSWRNRKSVVHDVSSEFSSVDNQVMQDVLSQSDIQTAINELADIARPKRLRTQSNSAVNEWDGPMCQDLDADSNGYVPWKKCELTASYDASYSRNQEYTRNRNQTLEQPVCERPKSWSIGRQVHKSKSANKRKSCPASTLHYNTKDNSQQSWSIAGLDRLQTNDCLWEWLDSPSENSLQRDICITQNETCL